MVKSQKFGLKDTKIESFKLVIYLSILALFLGLYPLWMNFSDKKTVEMLVYLIDNLKGLFDTSAFLAKVLLSGYFNVILSTILFNFSNITKLHIICTLFFTSQGMSAILKLIYLRPSVFFTSSVFLEPINCDFAWATPVTTAIYSTSVLFTLFWIFTPKGMYSKMIRNITFIIGLIVVIISNYMIMVYGYNSISDIIVSGVIGFMQFYFVFFILKLDHSNSQDMKQLMTAKSFYLIVNVLCTTAYLLLYFLRVPDVDTKENYRKMISRTDCYFSNPFNSDLHNDSLISFVIYFSNLAMLLGIYLDQLIIGNNDLEIWGYLNFHDDQNDLESLYTFTENDKDTQWNRTTKKKTAIRIVISVCFALFFSFWIKIIKLNQHQLVVSVLLKYGFPYFLYNFSIFFFQKWLFFKLKLVNMKAFRKEKSDKTTSLSSISINEM